MPPGRRDMPTPSPTPGPGGSGGPVGRGREARPWRVLVLQVKAASEFLPGVTGTPSRQQRERRVSLFRLETPFQPGRWGTGTTPGREG